MLVLNTETASVNMMANAHVGCVCSLLLSKEAFGSSPQWLTSGLTTLQNSFKDLVFVCKVIHGEGWTARRLSGVHHQQHAVTPPKRTAKAGRLQYRLTG